MRTIVGIALLASAVASPVLAQSGAASPASRQGFTISLGLGGGSAGVSCDGCDSDRENGASGYLRLGGAIRPNLVIGGETHGYRKTESEGGEEVTAQLSYLTAFAQWYPQPATGFFLKGGLGFGMINLDVGGQTLKSSGVGLTLGAGYDWRLGTNFSLTPYANYLLQGKGEAKVDGSSIGEKWGTNVFQLGLGVTWH